MIGNGSTDECYILYCQSIFNTEGNTIISNADNDVYFTISKNGTGYSIASKNGKYMNQSSNANGLQTVSQPDDPLSIALNEDGSVDIVGAEGGVVDLVKTFFPHLDVIVLRKMLCFDVSYLSFYLLIGKRAGVLRK